MENKLQITPVDKWFINPLKEFISNSVMGGITLFIAAVIAVIMANSPWSDWYLNLWKYKIAITLNGNTFLDYDIQHWINDGLVAVFFFVLGLELKREMVAGQLSGLKNATLPIIVGVSGMVFPAMIFLLLNGTSSEASTGWGIPMACDIAFILGVLYLLGDKVPASVKIFFTAFGIVDDLGAILIIALFYTDQISYVHLIIGLSFFLVLILANKLGVRNTLFYAVVGILGVWVPFLLSGIHATIAAVLVAFTIPVSTKISEQGFLNKIKKFSIRLNDANTTDTSAVTKEQLHILGEMKTLTKHAMTPLQRLEHDLHPVVSFIVMPLFALANAGVVFTLDLDSLLANNIFTGIVFGLIIGKFLGIFGVTAILVKLKMAKLPRNMTLRHLFGISILSGIGFTMCLFITGLAYNDDVHIAQAKLGIFTASILAGILGYIILKTGPAKKIITKNT
ncbi:Na+/H+ antiporter NhaA [Flavobacterium cerinum]|uniref:Na(+)/H(+) antiporter NhaA n=1 Tax=Flavobacterium cerinum TaxID=2502784 RepID=A0A3S3QSE8_9FLAO|nr:Na+/H+ antiporter NhaA [Flavobacterium cerinum]RWX00475.1 Na+/H+ antiporter NhaA [Flavobacterium cerinum]